MSAHTPGPWRTGEGIGNFGCNRIWYGVANRDAHPIAMLVSQSMQPPDLDPEAQANAKFIVRACNSHDALLEALLAIIKEPHGCRFCDSGTLRISGDPEKAHDDDCGYLLARAAIAKVEA